MSISLPRLSNLGLRELTLTLLGIVLLVTLVILAGGIFAFVLAAEQAGWHGRLAEATDSAAESISAFLETARNSMSLADGIEEVIQAQQPDEEAAQNQLSALLDQLILTNSAVDELILTNDEGEIDGSPSQQPSEALLFDSSTIRQSDWFSKAIKGNFYLGDLQLTSQNDPYIIMAIPLADEGVGAVRLRMDVLQNVVAATQLGETGDAYLVNMSGQVIAHVEDEADAEAQEQTPFVNISGRPEYVAALTASDNQWSGTLTNFSGEDVLSTSKRVPGTNWIIFTEVEQSEAFATSRGALLLLGGITLGFWVVVMAFATRFLSRLVFRPLESLRAGTERIEGGDMTHQVAISRQDEIGQVTTSFNRMVTRLSQQTEALREARDAALAASQVAQESSRLKSEFLSTMSHELRTPLNAIEGFTSIMLNGMGIELPPKAKSMVERISANSKRLLVLINDFLDLSRIESGRQEIVKQPISPAKLVDRWVSQTSVLAEKKGIQFEIEIDPDLPAEVLGDEDALTKITTNLLSNAFKFTHQGKVSLRVKKRDQNLWTIEVADTGIGIPIHAREYIFEEFRQVDSSSKRLYGGTGLGLAIVQKLARLMGGSVALKSELGKGSSFLVVLPLQTNLELEVA